MLTGSDLLAFVQANPDTTQRQLAKGAGYVRISDSGKELILEKAFCQALLSAKGFAFKKSRSTGKSARYETTVHRSGVVLLGKTYVKRFGLEPGDELSIILEDDAIRLIPKTVGGASDEEEETISIPSSVKAVAVAA